jgi:RNA recognition motif-containing protein
MSVGERKVFVGGLIHSTTSQMLMNYFQKFGPIEEANIITDKHSGNSKGYGFVTFYDLACAAASVKDPSPLINGKVANCNLSTKPSPINESSDNKRMLSAVQNSGRVGGPINSGRSNRDRDGGERGWGEKRSRPNPSRVPNYLQRLRNEGHVITKEIAIEKIELDRTTNPAEAFKYFLEVSDLFRGSIEFGYYATLLLKQARHYRSTGEVLVEDDHSKRQAQEQSRVDMNKEGEQQNAEADQTAHFQQFEQQAHDEHEQDYQQQGDDQHYDENQGQEMEQDYENNQYQNDQEQQYEENNYNNEQQQQYDQEVQHEQQ